MAGEETREEREEQVSTCRPNTEKGRRGWADDHDMCVPVSEALG